MSVINSNECQKDTRPFGMLFAVEASEEETKMDEMGVPYIDTIDYGTSKTSNTQ